jgi:hypothetical protein
MFDLKDIQSYCHDLSRWIEELGLVGELAKANPKATFPLTADEEDIEGGWETLVYLTVWMCLQAKTKAPPHLESRILLCGNLKGPWKLMYSKCCCKLESKEVPNKTLGFTMLEMIDVWDLAS